MLDAVSKSAVLDHKGVIAAAALNIGCSGSNSERELLVACTEVNRCAIQRTGDVDRILISYRRRSQRRSRC